MPDDRAVPGWALTVEAPSGFSRRLIIADGHIHTVGRSRNCDLCLPVDKDLGFSRQHCKLVAQADRISVTNCFEVMMAPVVDGAEVPQGGTADAFDGSIIEMGKVRLLVARVGFAESVAETAAQERGTVAEGTIATRHQEAGAYQDDEQDGGRTMPIAANPHNTAAATVFTREPIATQGDKTAGTAANKPTIFIDPAELLRLQKEYESQRPKKKSPPPIVLILAVFFLLMAALGIKTRGKGNEVKWAVSSHPWMAVAVPSDWTARESGRIVCLSGNKTVGGLYAVAAYREEGPDIRWWDFDHASATCLKMMGDDLPQVNGKNTGEADVVRDNSRQPMIGMLGDISPVTFVALAGRSGLGRLFLDNNQVIFLFVVCDENPKTRASAEKILDSFAPARLLREKVFIDRRRVAAQMNAALARSTLKDAQFFFTNRLLSPENAWKAYSKALTIWQWISSDGDPDESFSRVDRNYVWEILTVASRHLNEQFKTYYFDIRTAYAMGDRVKGDRLVREVQEFIPDRSDYRWTWAEKQHKKNQVGSKKNTGVFSK